MKKKIICWSIIGVLVAGTVFFMVRSTVGWRPYKNFVTEDIAFGGLYRITMDEKTECCEILRTYHSRFAEIMNDMKVVPYRGEYDPFDNPTMFFVYKLVDHPQTAHRVGVTFDPEPLLSIGGNVYRISEEMAEAYRELWGNCR